MKFLIILAAVLLVALTIAVILEGMPEGGIPDKNGSYPTPDPKAGDELQSLFDDLYDAIATTRPACETINCATPVPDYTY